nr:MAG TPA_asm: Uridine phosphorylase [Caudoviricetes sp.]
MKVKWSKENLNFKGKIQMASLKLDYPKEEKSL